jgi:hypothetical protein
MRIPPSHVLEALRRPRRVQLHDPAVKTLLARWKRLGHPIEYADLDQVAAILRVENPRARTRRKIVAAVEAAGIEIHNYDGWRRRLRESRMHVSLTGEGCLLRIEEQRWRWPEKWDNDRRQKRATCVRVRRGRLEYVLKRERLKPGDEILPWPDDEERWV